jgi:hypothetical protein
MMGKALIGGAATTIVVLLARSLAYAAMPAPEARMLAQRAGGPAVPVVALVALALAAALAIAICWLAAVAVRERALLKRRPAEPFAAGRALALAAVLAVASTVAGGLLEAYLHWRAGLGWHGLHCLVGPVHRDLIPFETGLSLVAAAIIAAGRHVVAWMRRTFARLGAELPLLHFAEPPSFTDTTALRIAERIGVASARAPPTLG